MAKYKLLSEEYEEIDYQLIAIHTSIEDYRLAYFINKNLPITLSKCKADISIHENNQDIQFTRFFFDDQKNHIYWNLVQNKNQGYQNLTTLSTGLFLDNNASFSTKKYLIPEYKKVDFFLKIETDLTDLMFQQTLAALKTIPKISTVYPVAIEKIKSKNNLIF
jgi:hypothetical protein